MYIILPNIISYSQIISITCTAENFAPNTWCKIIFLAALFPTKSLNFRCRKCLKHFNLIVVHGRLSVKNNLKHIGKQILNFCLKYLRASIHFLRVSAIWKGTFTYLVRLPLWQNEKSKNPITIISILVYHWFTFVLHWKCKIPSEVGSIVSFASC